MSQEVVFSYKTRGDSSPKDKPRVYFTCHPVDFERYFEKVCEDIFKTHDCVIYYTDDMTAELSSANNRADLERMNLFVIPVTYCLLTQQNRAMDSDFRFAIEKHIPVLPIMMEPGIDEFYSKPDKFGELQYINPYSCDLTEISYEEKLKKYLESVLISDELAQRVRKAFDAYIFLSYRKKDRGYANELMKLIHKNPECRDIAIWFDEFLTPGESFKENIDRILQDSALFTLLVTPSLLEKPDGKPNYVMGEEYPAAKVSGKEILPAEMKETDREALSSFFADIPDCVNAHNDEGFRKRLLESLKRVAISENNNDPEHNYLIGLAYLEGIDVERNVDRGVELITKAAEACLPEAMKKLSRMYYKGEGVGINYQKVLSWEKKLVEYYEKKYGEENPVTLSWLNELAITYSCLGDRVSYMSLCEKVYSLRCKVLGENHPDSITSLNNLAASYNSFGLYERALEMAKKAYEIRCAVYGSEDSATMISLANLAMAYGGIGDVEKKREIYEGLYLLRCKISGENHPDTLTILNNLAVTYGQLNDRTKEIELLTKAYTICCDVLGDEHPNALVPLYNLAFAYEEIGNFHKAYSLYKKVYKARCKVLGDEHPDTLLTIERLSSIYWESFCSNTELQLDTDYAFWIVKFIDLAGRAFAIQKYEEAMTLYSRALSIQQRSNGQIPTNEEKMAIAYTNLGYLFRKQKQYTDSLKYHDLAIKFINKLSPSILTDYLKCLADNFYGLGHCYRMIGNEQASKDKYLKAIELYKSFYSMQGENVDKNHPANFGVLPAIAQCYSELNMHDKAVEYYEEAYERLLLVCGRYNPQTEFIHDKLLNEYREIWGCESEIELYQKEYEIICKCLGEKHIDTLTAQHKLAYCYVERGDYKKANEIFQKVYALRCETLGPEHAHTIAALYNIAYNYGKLGEHKTAIKCWEQVYELYRKTRGETDEKTIAVLRLLAGEYYEIGEHRKDYELSKMVYDLRRKSLGEEHLSTLQALYDLAWCQYDLGEYEKSVELFDRVYKTQSKTQGQNSEDALDSLSSMAKVLCFKGDLKEALEICDAIVKNNTELPKSVLRRIADVYEKSGEKDKAAEVRSRIDMN